jgi:hypothetical protein
MQSLCPRSFGGYVPAEKIHPAGVAVTVSHTCCGFMHGQTRPGHAYVETHEFEAIMGRHQGPCLFRTGDHGAVVAIPKARQL